MKSKVYLILLMLFSLSIFLNAHSGRTDSSGGHYNNKSGGYHSHSGFDGLLKTLIAIGILAVVIIIPILIERKSKKMITTKPYKLK